MGKPAVEVVVINWKRPQNVTRILRAFREGSVPCTLTLCDVRASEEFAPEEEALAIADHVYRWTHNMRSYNRYVPCGGYDHEYTHFHDDDNLPGSRCLENFLDQASGRKIGVLGQFGRRLPLDGQYCARSVRRLRGLEEVDLVVQAYFVLTRVIGYVPMARYDFLQTGGREPDDDILLAIAMQRAGLGSWIVPRSDDPETSVRKERLPAPHALADRTDHIQNRTIAFAQARQIGWRPMSHRPASAARHMLRSLRK